jgi:hypothetical protein
MNTDKLKLQHPDTITNTVISVSVDTANPAVNHNPIRTEDTMVPSNIINRNISLEIPKWNTFNDANNSIPTMDASPIYAKNSPDCRTRKKYTQRNPIVSRTHDETNHNNIHDIDDEHYSNRSFVLRCCEYFFS